MQKGSKYSGAEILLPLHLRVLLQSLRSHFFPGPYEIQASVSGLAGLSAGPLRAGMGLEYLHEHLQPVEARHPKRKNRIKG